MVRSVIFFLLVVMAGAPPGYAQLNSPAVAAALTTSNRAFDGPPVPTLPAIVTRDEEGRTTVRAVRLTEPLHLDGRLDERLYTTVTPISDFIQNEPVSGARATERTEVWLSFDGANVYVTVRAWESEPERMVVNEMRRDSDTIVQNENFAFVFDTFFDRRSGVVFNINPIGGHMDGQISNEGNYNGDWNPVWSLAVGRFPGGWVAEAAIPFKSLRYNPGAEQIWGFNARRINRWKNEVSFLSRVPDGSGVGGLFRVSSAATLVGIEVSPLRNVDVKPFVISDLTSNLAATPPVTNHLNGDFGLDAKIGITPGLTADLTYRTDFAQAEADEQQVNLTRFNLFFPEKREFFLENQGVFQFGGASGRGNVPLAFYSRRIGLEDGVSVPIQGGGRLTGRVGQFSLGVINVETDSTSTGLAATNFSVARVRRDILRRSSVGALFTRRSLSTKGPGSNELYGLDARFAFFQNLTIDTYWAKTQTAGLDGKDASYRVQFRYDGDRYGLNLHELHVGEHFNPEAGFIFRSDIDRRFGQVRFSPRPVSIPAVRKFSFQGQLDHITNATTGRLESRNIEGQFDIDFQNSDNLQITYNDIYEGLLEPFDISSGVTIPVGDYAFHNLRTAFRLGQQRRLSGTLFVEQGTFWSGDKTSFGMSGGRLKLSTHLAIEPGLSVNRVTLPFGSFTAKLINSRITYTITPLMFVSSLVQFNSSDSNVSANVRLRWEYQSGSEIFVVFDESRETSGSGYPSLQNRSLVIKINRLFRL